MFNNKLKNTIAEQTAQIARQQALIDAIDRSNARIEFTPEGIVTDANRLVPALIEELKAVKASR